MPERWRSTRGTTASEKLGIAASRKLTSPLGGNAADSRLNIMDCDKAPREWLAADACWIPGAPLVIVNAYSACPSRSTNATRFRFTKCERLMRRKPAGSSAAVKRRVVLRQMYSSPAEQMTT